MVAFCVFQGIGTGTRRQRPAGYINAFMGTNRRVRQSLHRNQSARSTRRKR